jgi:hypothetical protein
LLGDEEEHDDGQGNDSWTDDGDHEE